MSKKRLDKVFKAVVGSIFLPARVITSAHLSWAAWIIIALGLISPLVLAEPHVKDAAFCYLFSTPTEERRETIKNVCDYAVICFQILIAVSIGGVAFTEIIVQRIRDRLEITESRSLKVLDSWQKYFLRGAIKTYVDIRYAPEVVNSAGLVRWLKRVGNDLTRTYRMSFTGEFYYFNILLILARVGVAFPGGFYGVVAFISFEGLISAQTIKTYFDYPLNCY